MMMIIIKIMMIYNILDVSTTWIMNDASTQFQPCSLLTLFVTFTFLECRPQRNLVLLWTLILIWDAGTSEATSIVRHSDWLLHCFVSPELKQSRSVKSSIFCMKRHSTLHSKCTNVSCCILGWDCKCRDHWLACRQYIWFNEAHLRFDRSIPSKQPQFIWW